jgi:hypothetical protein
MDRERWGVLIVQEVSESPTTISGQLTHQLQAGHRRQRRCPAVPSRGAGRGSAPAGTLRVRDLKIPNTCGVPELGHGR